MPTSVGTAKPKTCLGTPLGRVKPKHRSHLEKKTQLLAGCGQIVLSQRFLPLARRQLIEVLGRICSIMFGFY